MPMRSPSVVAPHALRSNRTMPHQRTSPRLTQLGCGDTSGLEPRDMVALPLTEADAHHSHRAPGSLSNASTYRAVVDLAVHMSAKGAR